LPWAVVDSGPAWCAAGRGGTKNKGIKMANENKNADPKWVEEQCRRFEEVLKGFTAAMRAEFRRRAETGQDRWEDQASAQKLQDNLVAHSYHAPLAAGEEVHCANLAAFLWHLRMKRVGS
jgi:hypothetical protein